MGQKDYYEILGTTKTATPKEVKKAFHKASLTVHPDRNKAPQSDEAQKKLN